MTMPQRLRSGTDIRAVFRSRNVAHGSAAVVYARAREDRDPARVAVVAGRKLGSAVQRNRAKRRLRAALQQVRLTDGVDVVVVARGSASTDAFPDLVAQLDGLVRRAAGDPWPVAS